MSPGLFLPGHLAAKQPAPVGFAATVATVLTDAGVTLEVRLFDPRDTYKRQHALRVDVDTLSPPQSPTDATPAT